MQCKTNNFPTTEKEWLYNICLFNDVLQNKYEYRKVYTLAFFKENHM